MDGFCCGCCGCEVEAGPSNNRNMRSAGPTIFLNGENRLVDDEATDDGGGSGCCLLVLL